MNLLTVAVFDTMPDAHIALGRLQVEGIEAWLKDENLVQTDWLYAIAVGGIKLQVVAENAALAKQILARDDSAELGVSGDLAGNKPVADEDDPVEIIPDPKPG